MSWQDPDNPWLWAMNKKTMLLRRTAICVFGVGVTLAVFIGNTVITAMIKLGGDLSWFLALFIIFQLFICSLLVMSIMYQIKRIKVLTSLVPEHDGLVCPQCSITLNEDISCMKCISHYKADELRRFWEQFAYDQKSSRLWLKKAKRAMFDDQGVKIKQLWSLSKKLTVGGIGFGVLVLIIMFVKSLSYMSVGQASIYIAYIVGRISVLLFSMYFLHGGYRRHYDRTRRCSRCDYQQVPDLPVTAQCPECGSNWKGWGMTVGGTRRIVTWKLVVGGVLMAIWIVMPYVEKVFKGSNKAMVFGAVPVTAVTTSLTADELIEKALASTDELALEWVQLDDYELTDKQIRTLAVGLLDRRLKTGSFGSYFGDQWITERVVAEKLPFDLIDRFYSQWYILRIDAANKAFVGQQVVILVDGNQRDPSCLFDEKSFLDESMYVEGFYIGEEDKPLARGDCVNLFSSFCARPPDGQRLSEDWREDQPRVSITVKEPGRLKVRFVYWLVVDRGDPFDHYMITWKEDDTPVLPDSVVWAKRFVIEHEILVSEEKSTGN